MTNDDELQSPDRASTRELFGRALTGSGTDSLEALMEAGPDIVEELRAYLAKEFKLPHRIDGLTLADLITELSIQIARQFPDAFLSTFDNARWKDNSVALSGLGATRRPQARELLIQALHGSESWGVRVDAAAALSDIPGRESVDALIVALNDPHYLVQYNAIRSLGTLGDTTALDRLYPLANSDNRAISGAAEAAISALTTGTQNAV